ncbi:MAG: hypothetical protein QXQ11_08975 [Candidatus Bathyarchaeia archaeon]
MIEGPLIAILSGLVGGGIGHSIGWNQGYQHARNELMPYIRDLENDVAKLRQENLELKAMLRRIESELEKMKEREEKRDEQIAKLISMLQQILKLKPMEKEASHYR